MILTSNKEFGILDMSGQICAGLYQELGR
jgi:hypothetical protein